MNPLDHFKPDFLLECILMAEENVSKGLGGPFAALVVKGDTIIGRGVNNVIERQDPTAHAEIMAIREACQTLGSFQLQDCYLYSSCEPCPMCMGAVYWARPRAIFFAASRKTAARSGFDDSFIYDELNKYPDKRSIPAFCFFEEKGQIPFSAWDEKTVKELY